MHNALKVRPLAVEPVSDIAVLGALDDQMSPGEAEQFEAFCQQTRAIALGRDEPDLDEPITVYIYTHRRTWVTASATRCTVDGASLFIEANEQIEPGTSGGPVANEARKLIAVVSNFSEVSRDRPTSYGAHPRPHLTLPTWACRRILGRDRGIAAA